MWFQKNEKGLRQEIAASTFLGRGLISLEINQQVNLFELLKKLTDFGYERVQTLSGPGEFLQQGGSLQIFPVNQEQPWQIEFKGKEIETLAPLGLERLKETKTFKLKSIKTEGLARILKENDYAVHLDHGIGIYKGVIERNREKYFLLAYARNDKLLVPLKLEEKISPYVGLEKPIVHRLGGSLWRNTKRKAKEDTVKFAQQLLELYAAREQSQGHAFPKETWMEKELAADFPYQETPDQEKAIAEVFCDMEKEAAMDHLVCGDVGFGKTEVALRAAFKAVLAGKQAAILAPTTILAKQHWETFKARLEKFSVRAALLSRLTPQKEQPRIIEDLNAGKIDIVIGTHRLIQKDVSFKDLGLLVIDEEQRFGVKQKEKLKTLKASVDVLSLSATPIPRTLHLALAGLRRISQITTPPLGRRAIKTFVLPSNQKIVAQAINFELQRGGQVYFLHNRVATIEAQARQLKKLFPQAKIARIHGRLNEREMTRIIDDFKNKKIDILVATTIIENGLDFPAVNTLLVADASRLGLAQSYQLRGRVGRSDLQAFAYFLYPAKRLTQKATQRLDALREAQSLGSGYNLALRDLEIRGAGNILGREQSGALNTVGLNLYYQMLSETIEELRGK